MSRHHTILAQASIAVATCLPRLTHAVARAAAGDHDEAVRGLQRAQRHARELLTRLEISELELTAQPIETRNTRSAA